MSCSAGHVRSGKIWKRQNDEPQDWFAATSFDSGGVEAVDDLPSVVRVRTFSSVWLIAADRGPGRVTAFALDASTVLARASGRSLPERRRTTAAAANERAGLVRVKRTARGAIRTGDAVPAIGLRATVSVRVLRQLSELLSSTAHWSGPRPWG